jgi:hypothetical protein
MRKPGLREQSRAWTFIQFLLHLDLHDSTLPTPYHMASLIQSIHFLHKTGFVKLQETLEDTLD